MNNTLINVILSNRGFKNQKVNADLVDVDTVKEWHKLCDQVLSEAYSVAATCYNKTADINTFNSELDSVNLSGLYSAMQNVFAYIGEVRGAKLHPNKSTATVLVALATTTKAGYSPEMQYKKSQLSNAKKLLAQYEQANGVELSSINNIKADIATIEADIEELSKVEWAAFKKLGKVGASTFYKSFEDYVADCIQHRLAQTEEELQAEAEARKAARKAKKAAKNK